MKSSIFYEEIVKPVFGKINPVGETNEDAKRLENIPNYANLAWLLLCELKEVADQIDRKEGSIKLAARTAAEELKSITEYIEQKED